MELTRRKFLTLALAGAAAVACGIGLRAARGARRVGARLFPGRVRPLDMASVRKPGRWAG